MGRTYRLVAGLLENFNAPPQHFLALARRETNLFKALDGGLCVSQR